MYYATIYLIVVDIYRAQDNGAGVLARQFRRHSENRVLVNAIGS